ncbi:MAG: hypothetical protein RLZZ297_848 [Chloroflexota bacterium]|jgi:hypothetical protein
MYRRNTVFGWVALLVMLLVTVPFVALAEEAPPISDGSSTSETAQPAPTQAPPAFQQGFAPTYSVRATREGLVGKKTANGYRIPERAWFVALPSWKVLSSQGGNEFMVRVTYKDKSIVVPVWDVGPWNTNDEYWTPERRFYRDLPTGMPMAQAAVDFGYNGGLDMFGRKVTIGNGIDIADGAFWDGLGMVRNDWVKVTFLWMGNDPGPGGLVDSAAANTAFPPGTVIIDNGAAGYNSAAKVEWYENYCGLNGTHAWTIGTNDVAKGENDASWETTLNDNNYYEIMAFIPPCGKAASRQAIYRVNNNGEQREVWVDQALQSGRWASLGIYNMKPGFSKVSLNDITGDNGQGLRFDAMMWVPRYDNMPPTAWVQEVAPMEGGSVYVKWGGSDDVSGIQYYDVQVRRDGGEWIDWQPGTGSSEALFSPDGPGSYEFRARATDWMQKQGTWDVDPITIKGIVIP